MKIPNSFQSRKRIFLMAGDDDRDANVASFSTISARTTLRLSTGGSDLSVRGTERERIDEKRVERRETYLFPARGVSVLSSAKQQRYLLKIRRKNSTVHSIRRFGVQ